jgi:hypothetical protein
MRGRGTLSRHRRRAREPRESGSATREALTAARVPRVPSPLIPFDPIWRWLAALRLEPEQQTTP